MTLNEYQEKAMSTCMPSCENPLYMLLNLQGEIGELCSKYAKLIRKGYLVFNENQFTLTDEFTKLSVDEINEIERGLVGELGDIAWMLAGLSSVLGYDYEHIHQMNLDKLASRQKRGVIDGNGDNR